MTMRIEESPEFRAKVREWNERHRDSGWRSGAEFLQCPRCDFAGVVTVTTIRGVTQAGCPACRTMWTVEV